MMLRVGLSSAAARQLPLGAALLESLAAAQLGSGGGAAAAELLGALEGLGCGRGHARLRRRLGGALPAAARGRH